MKTKILTIDNRRTKINKLLLILCASFIFTACGAVAEKVTGENETATGAKPQIGDTVIFKTSGANYSEGKVEKIDGSKFEIRAADYIAKPDAADVYALPKTGAKADVKAGDYVVVYSGNNIYWAGGEVKNVSDQFIEVEPATGNKINAAPDKVFKVSPAATADIKQAVEMKAFTETGKTKKPVLPKNWKPKKGDRVAAQWAFGTWHSAVIKNVNANNIDIDWQNGWSDGTVGSEKIAPSPTAAGALPKTGDYVIVKPQSDIEEWKFAVVESVSGTEADIKFGDGKTRKVKAGDFIAMN